MRINTASAWWQGTLAVGSALAGVALASGLGWATRSNREITIYANEARSDLDGPGIWPDSRTKQISIHEYVVKNTGNVAFDQIRVRLSPTGGDAAYDSTTPQSLEFAGISSSQAIPDDIKITRDHNAVIVDIKEVQPSEEFGFTITNDGIADSYVVSVLPANIKVIENESLPWKPQSFSDLSISVKIFLILAAIIMIIQIVWFVLKYLQFIKKKIEVRG